MQSLTCKECCLVLYALPHLIPFKNKQSHNFVSIKRITTKTLNKEKEGNCKVDLEICPSNCNFIPTSTKIQNFGSKSGRKGEEREERGGKGEKRE